MKLSHQDQISARAYFAENQVAFEDWISHKDAATDHFGGAAEAAALFVSFCEALSEISGAVESISKILEHAKKLATFAKDLFARKAKGQKAEHFELSERLLILVFDNYMRSGKGVSMERLIALTGAKPDEAEKELRRFEKAGVIRSGKSGWLAVH